MLKNICFFWKQAAIILCAVISSLLFNSCSQENEDTSILLNKMQKLSEKHGFEVDLGTGPGLNFKDLNQYEKFLLETKSSSPNKNGEIIKLLLEQTNYNSKDLENSKSNEELLTIEKKENYQNSKILCLQNAHLVNVRIPIIYGAGIFPSYEDGGGLGVNVGLALQNGSITSNLFYTYGIVPFTGVVGGLNIVENTNGNIYSIYTTFSLSYNIIVEGLTFYVTEPRYFRIRVNGCDGTYDFTEMIP